MFNFNNEAIKSSKTSTTNFDSEKYKFSSQKKLDKFLIHTEADSRRYGRYCACVLATTYSKKADIDPKAFAIGDGTLYLFYHSWGNNTLKKMVKKKCERFTRKSRLKFGGYKV